MSTYMIIKFKMFLLNVEWKHKVEQNENTQGKYKKLHLNKWTQLHSINAQLIIQLQYTTIFYYSLLWKHEHMNTVLKNHSDL